MEAQPTLLDAIDFASCLKSRISFLSLALHSVDIQDALDADAYDGLLWFLSDFYHDFERLEAKLDVVLKGGKAS